MKSQIKEEFYKFLKDPLHEDKLIAALEKLRQVWLQHRQNEHDERWRQNISFYAGKHYVRTRGKDTSQYRVRLKENHTNNIINRAVSIIVQNMPVTRVFPATDQNADVQAAEASESWIKYFYKTKQLEQKYAKLVKYAFIMGNGFTFRGWDPHAGGMMSLSSEETGGEPEERRWRGDVRVDIDDPLKILVRPGIEDIDDMYDFFRSVPSNKDDLEAVYGKIEAEPIKALNAATGQTRTDEDQTMVHHYFHKPTHWLEEGLYICYVGKKVLKATTFPYKSGKLPLEHLPFDKSPLSFWAMSSMDQIMDLQEQLNRASSMIVEARNLIARPRVFASVESQVPGQSFSDRPGDIIRYKQAGGAPNMVVPNFNFAEMNAHKGDLRAAIQQISGISGASRGEIPAATKTALALQLVLEQDRSQWAPFIKHFYQVVRNTNQGILEIAAEYIPQEDPRVIKINNNEGGGEITFHGGLVPSPLDIELEDTNPLGWTAAGRIEATMSLYQAGLIKNPDQALEMLELSNTDPAFQFQKINRQTAKKENELMNRGEMVAVESEDMDPVHLSEHVKEMVSFQYKDKPLAVKRAFEEHVATHKARMSGAAPAPGGAPSGSAANTAGDNLAGQVAPPPVGPERMNELITSARSG